MKTTLCDGCECKLNNKKDYYIVHIAIYVNHDPMEMTTGEQMPKQLFPQEADLCKRCMEDFKKGFSVHKIKDYESMNRRYVDSLWSN